MSIPGRIAGMLGMLRTIYRPKYIALNIAAAAIYYLMAMELVRIQNSGIFLLLSAPVYLFDLLILTSSMLLTIAIYAAFNTQRNEAEVAASSLGTVTTLAAGVISGCGCSAPLILNLTVFGLSAAELFEMSTFLTGIASEIFAAMIVINLATIIYYLNKLHNPTCRIPRKQRKK